MNEKMKNLKARMAALLAAAKGYMEGENKDVEKSNAKMAEYNAVKAEYEAEKAIFEAERDDVAEQAEKQVKAEKQEEQKKAKLDAVAKFAAAAKEGFRKDMSEGSGEDGGYTVPEDISTRIDKFRDTRYSLRQDVSVVYVTTNSGARTFKQRSQQTGFQKVGEGAKIGKKETPKFTRIQYTIEKYAGYFPITNELLADSDANIVDSLIEWIGDEDRVTNNIAILAEIKEKWSKLTNFKDLKGIKTALNKKLGKDFKDTSVIYTNDDGLNWLDNLVDGMGRPLLNPDPTASAVLRLRCGATTVPIRTIPNRDLPNLSGASEGYIRVPFIIGDMKEAIKLFDRRQRSIKASDVAATSEINAFEEDMTLWRGITRFDVEAKDLKALVNGYIDIEDDEEE